MLDLYIAAAGIREQTFCFTSTQQDCIVVERTAEYRKTRQWIPWIMLDYRNETSRSRHSPHFLDEI